mgnify:CR=1 FL=1
MRELKEGIRVVLVSGVHGNGLNNPVWGGKYSCKGTLEYQKNPEYVYAVSWDNGYSNSYREGELEEVDKSYTHPFMLEEASNLWTI